MLSGQNVAYLLIGDTSTFVHKDKKVKKIFRRCNMNGTKLI